MLIWSTYFKTSVHERTISDNSAQNNFVNSATRGVFCACTNFWRKIKGFRPFFTLLLSAAFLLISCDPPDSTSPPPELKFSKSEVFKSKGSTKSVAQTYTNKLTYGRDDVTASATCQITGANPAASNIVIDANTGELTFQDTLATITVKLRIRSKVRQPIPFE